MRVLLWHRLFIASLLLSAAVLATFVVWQQAQFRSGFHSYLEAVALERAQGAATRLSEAYAAQGSWDFLRRNEGLFGRLTDVDREPFGPRNVGAASGRERGGDSRRDPAPTGPPPAFADNVPAPPPGFSPDPTRDRHGPPPPFGGGPQLWSRMLLVDADDVKVAGLPDIERGDRKVAVMLDTEQIGTLYLAAIPTPVQGPEQAFAQTQWRAGWIAALVLLLAALMVALMTARHLLRPVHALSGSVAAITQGDYSARIAAPGDDELGRLAQGVNQMAATLEQHRAARQQWGADIAHELRTPITILRAEIQAMVDGLRQPSRKAFDSLLAEAERLSRLVEDLYQLSLMDADALDYVFEPLDLVTLVRRGAESFRPRLRDAGLELELDLPDQLDIDADPTRLAQLLDNLLTNSLRYTTAPGRVRVIVSAQDNQAGIRVEDSAPGVAAEHLPRLFDRLFRVEVSRSRAYGGAGLGLSICTAIVQAHGGSIVAAESALGGLSVGVRLPIRQD
jgi:two-component system sensor histidine kinase BaeS